MKRSILFVMLLAGMTAASAQTPGIEDRDQEQNNRVNYPLMARERSNIFAAVEIEMKHRMILFSDLPEMKKAYAAVITNGSGEQVRKKRVSPADNEVNLQGLGRGLYFITIEYKGKGRKTFVVNY